MKTVNSQKLKELVENCGGIAQFSVLTGVSVSWIQKALSGGYTRNISRITIDAVKNNTNCDIDAVFPTVAAKRMKAS